MTTPAPSPMMKPSRSLSNGRLARDGSSLRVDSARIEPKPPTLIGVIAASEPPAIIAIGVAAADDLERLADGVRRRRAGGAGGQVRSLGAEADRHLSGRQVDDGGRDEERRDRRGPPSSSALCSRSMVMKPPMPEPMNTPTSDAFSAVICSFASSMANCDAAIAYWMKTSIFLTSFFSMNCSGSKPLTSAAIWAA